MSTSPQVPVSRRAFLQAGLAAVGGLTLANVLRLRAAARTERRTSVIFVFLAGGAAQHETFDPKPDAPVEVRGPFGSLATSVPGVRFSETLPRLAQVMQHLAVVRSVTHHEASHIAEHVVESGYFLQNVGNARAGEMPAVGCVAAQARGAGPTGLPGFVTLPRPHAYCGPAHLGARCAPFAVDGNPDSPEFQVANLALGKGLTPALLDERHQLLRAVGDRPRVREDPDPVRGLETFHAQAFDLLTGDRARRAFDLSREPDRLRERYGRNDIGQRLLLARRLAEAEVPFIAVRHTPNTGIDWDDHADLPGRMKKRAPVYDQGLAALVEDLRQRGLERDVLVVAMGEFGRTPRVNKDAGRDHWPAVTSVLLAGGRYRMGQVIGGTDAQGGAVKAAPYPPQSVLTMAYLHLGIDPAATFPDFTGRPRHVLDERRPIGELMQG